MDDLTRYKRQALAAEETAADLRRRLEKAESLIGSMRSELDRLTGQLGFDPPDAEQAKLAIEHAWIAESANDPWPSRRATAAGIAEFLRDPTIDGATDWRQKVAAAIDAAVPLMPWRG